MAGKSNFLTELRRRNVFKVGVAYAIVAWLLIQVIVSIEAPLHLPDWVDTLTIIFLIVGFPVALIFAWAFELTPEGVKRTRLDHLDISSTDVVSRKFEFIVIGLMAAIILFLLSDKYFLKGDQISHDVPVVSKEKSNELVKTSIAADRKSVAVLPFANRSETEGDAFFVDGMHDDILTQLAKISSLKVISRTSVMGYRDTTKNMKTIGNELGVATLLEGGVQRAGNRVRINIQLIDVDTDEHIWAETYNKELTTDNIFEIQEQIATAIAKALRTTLSPEEQERIAAVPTQNLAAYEAYLLGRQRMVSRTSDKLAEAVGYFEQAITLDPAFALAYVGLSDVTQLQFLYAGLPRDEMNAKAEYAIHKALELDGKLGEAYASLGLLKLERHDYDGAKVAFKKALALNPNYATSYHWYGSLLSDLGQDKEAMEQMQKALALDPLSIVINANVATFQAESGNFDEAMAHFDKIIEIDPTTAQGYLGKGRLHWSVYGRLDEADPFLRKALSLDPNSPQYHAMLGALYLTLGDDKRAECVINLAMRFGPESLFSNIMLAYLHASRNELKQALLYARKSHKMDPNKGDVLLFIRDAYLQAGEYDKARVLYEESMPALLNEDEPVINKTNYRNAIDLAYVLQLNGEQDRADHLLELSLAFIRSGIHRLDFDGYKINDVRIYALQGEKQQALNALRQAIDEGWRDGWWYSLEIDRGLDSIRTEPEFQAMLAEIKSDMSEQLGRVKSMVNEGDVCADP